MFINALRHFYAIYMHLSILFQQQAVVVNFRLLNGFYAKNSREQTPLLPIAINLLSLICLVICDKTRSEGGGCLSFCYHVMNKNPVPRIAFSKLSASRSETFLRKRLPLFLTMGAYSSTSSRAGRSLEKTVEIVQRPCYNRHIRRLPHKRRGAKDH